ncbi:unnamed protein product [Echinostoma caproni]|uniref:ATP-dependent Clp protease proteolytic subunit n=1 Tax=Echinostoma caproni TaxID=27848 RepID=A0A183A1W2_9TREM|nr:unnamed protein product [Echinostoma caproni]
MRLVSLSPKAKEILHTVGEDAYPNTDLIVHLVDYIMQTTQDGAILVFVPGIGCDTSIDSPFGSVEPDTGSQVPSSVMVLYRSGFIIIGFCY